MTTNTPEFQLVDEDGLIKDLYALRNLWLVSVGDSRETAAVKDFCNSVARLIRARAPSPDSIREKAQRVVDAFNEWLVTDFEDTLTADEADALRRIIAAEFGAGESKIAERY